MRAAIAADAIYKRIDVSKYGLVLLDDNEMEELGIPLVVRSSLLQADANTGFSAGLYRDGITGSYILAFRGTDNYEGIIEDVYQGLGMGLYHYQEAMRIADALKMTEAFNKNNIIITGHSLGGGMASAAACVSGFTAYTFNAAGLHRDTISDSGYPAALAQYDIEAKMKTALQSKLIYAYYAVR